MTSLRGLLRNARSMWPTAVLKKRNRFAFEFQREITPRLRHGTPFLLNKSVSEVSGNSREDQITGEQADFSVELVASELLAFMRE